MKKTKRIKILVGVITLLFFLTPFLNIAHIFYHSALCEQCSLCNFAKIFSSFLPLLFPKFVSILFAVGTLSTKNTSLVKEFSALKFYIRAPPYGKVL
ncbi:MAG: hypothetical protein NC905_00215 [Candidatus Omnitrophica bacterium]|nr:hypothetical protein [Candidatus Omnitrophota bacterium]